MRDFDSWMRLSLELSGTLVVGCRVRVRAVTRERRIIPAVLRSSGYFPCLSHAVSQVLRYLCPPGFAAKRESANFSLVPSSKTVLVHEPSSFTLTSVSFGQM